MKITKKDSKELVKVSNLWAKAGLDFMQPVMLQETSGMPKGLKRIVERNKKFLMSKNQQQNSSVTKSELEEKQ